MDPGLFVACRGWSLVQMFQRFYLENEPWFFYRRLPNGIVIANQVPNAALAFWKPPCFAPKSWSFLRVGPMIAVVMAPLMLFFAVEELSQSTDDPWWMIAQLKGILQKLSCTDSKWKQKTHLYVCIYIYRIFIYIFFFLYIHSFTSP